MNTIDSKSMITGPIFIIGTGRSGTTLVYELLANHPDLAWISNLTNRWPHRPELAWLSNLTNYALRGNQLRKRTYVPRPVEGYGAWSACFPGFERPYRPLRAADVTELARRRLRVMVAAHLRGARKPRFLGKWTGWSRIVFMQAVFPEARFIHVLRDGRAVARSLLSVPWWEGWEGPYRWRWGPLPPDLQAKWERFDCSFVALAGIQWKLLVDEIQESARALPADSYLEITYEELVADPGGMFRRILDFCSLPTSERLDAVVSLAYIENMNGKWSRDLTAEQKRILVECLGPDLHRLGYPT